MRLYIHSIFYLFFILFIGFLMGWLCIFNQLDSSPCLGSHVNWKVLPQDLCGILLCKF